MNPKRLLLTTDFSECSEHAFAAAAEIARRHEASIDIVNVTGALPPFAFGHSGGGYTLAEFQSDIRDRLAEIAEEFDGIDVTCESILGDPLREIVDKAEQTESDLIVLSTHGRSGLGHVLLGSVAERVVRKAPCSVLTIRPDA